MKTMDKHQIIDVLREIAELLEIREENVFKIRAYENAARVLEGNPHDLASLISSGDLFELKGIGKHTGKIISELFVHGHSKDYSDLRKGFPDTFFELFRIPGLGGKRIKILYKKFKIKSVAELEKLCKGDKLLDVDGFGRKSQDKILHGIELLHKAKGQFRVDVASAEAEKLLAHLKKEKGIQKIEIAGSLRRHKEIVKDIDILVSAKEPDKIHGAFVKYPSAESVIAHGDTKSSITLQSGINCDLRTVEEKQFPYALLYFTGSKEHNVAIRSLAKKKNIKINEYGLFRGTRNMACRDEAEIFKKLGLHYVPPEARENTGEVELVKKRAFPALVEERDIRGTFHVHSDYSDGVAPLERMVALTERMGLEYVGISDHSQSAKYAGGLEPERLKKQWREIDRLQKKFKIRIFKGTECDILGDGALDYKDPILKEMDFVIGSIHSRFNLPEKEMMARIKRAMDNKYLTFFGHPTGRLILQRESYAVDMPGLIDHAKKTGVVMELNANPHRLDLDWRMCRYAKEKGVPVSINPDAHSEEGLKDIAYGIGIARKGWLEKRDVVNTKPLSEIEKFLKRRR